MNDNKGVKRRTENRDFKAEVEALKAAYPDLDHIPEEVAQMMAKGKSAKEAYEAWKAGESDQNKEIARLQAENAQLKAENEALKKEIGVLKQNASTSARAVVSGVRGDKVDKPRDNGFLVGLDSKW